MISNKTYGICLVTLFATLMIVGLLSIRPKPVIARTNLEYLPREIAEYKGVDDTFPEAVNRELNADKQLYRHYRSGDGSQIDLYIGYYGTAKGGRTGHNPYACLPGAGWAIVDSRKIGIRQPNKTSDTELNYVQARRDGVNTVMVHWYQAAGATVLSTGMQQNIERFWGRLIRNRNDGAVIQITTQVPDECVDDARRRAQNFAELVLQLLPGYWPVEK
jgi:EpsI family protein